MRLHLIRHAEPVVDPTRPAAEWQLAAEQPGLAALRAEFQVPANAIWLTSPEPKAFATAAAMAGRDVPTDARLVEMRRGGHLSTVDFADAVARSMTSFDHPARAGWETGSAVQQRVLVAALAACARADAVGATDVLLVGHGTAWTLLVAALLEAPPDVAAWRRLRLPDHCLLACGRQRWRLERPWLASRT